MFSTVENRTEHSIFLLAAHEFQSALYEVACGAYRHAHISLRLFFELFSAGILFSAYELKLRSWLSGAPNSDISWSLISDPDKGIFSNSFLNAFNPALAESAKQYRALACTIYRECSEFVHGNLHTHEHITDASSYNGDMLIKWKNRAEAVRLCIIFTFAGRYLNFLPPDEQRKLETIMLETLGHLSGIQEIFGKS